MTVISSKEFATNQSKYFDLAMNEQVYIKNGENMFHLLFTNIDNTAIRERVYYEPDEDFNRSITADEFLEGALKIIDNIFANKKNGEDIYQVRYIANNHTVAQYL